MLLKHFSVSGWKASNAFSAIAGIPKPLNQGVFNMSKDKNKDKTTTTGGAKIQTPPPRRLKSAQERKPRGSLRKRSGQARI
jgi:hypothetical protein